MITPPELDELERLAKTATKGPWAQQPIVAAGGVWISAGGDPLLEPTHSWKQLFKLRVTEQLKSQLRVDWEPVPGQDPKEHPFWKQKEADAAFIVAMRNALPALIAAARRAIALEASLKAALDRNTKALKELKLIVQHPVTVIEREREEGPAWICDEGAHQWASPNSECEFCTLCNAQRMRPPQ